MNFLRQVPDNRAAFNFVKTWMGWDDRARVGQAGTTAGVIVRFNGGTTLRVADFRSSYLSREQTREIIVEPVHPKHQREDPDVGHQLRVDLPDLVELYLTEIRKGL